MTERQKAGYFLFAFIPLCIVVVLTFTPLLHSKTGGIVPADSAVRTELQRLDEEFVVLKRVLGAVVSPSSTSDNAWEIDPPDIYALADAVEQKAFPATLLDPEVLDDLRYRIAAIDPVERRLEQSRRIMGYEPRSVDLSNGLVVGGVILDAEKFPYSRIHAAFVDKFNSVVSRRDEIRRHEPMIPETVPRTTLIGALVLTGLAIPFLYFLAVWGNGSVFLESLAIASRPSTFPQLIHTPHSRPVNHEVSAPEHADSSRSIATLSPTNAFELQQKLRRKTPLGRWIEKNARLGANKDTYEITTSETEVIKAQGEQILAIGQLQNDIDDQQDYALTRPLRRATTVAKHKADAEEHNLRRAEAVQKKKDLPKKEERPAKSQIPETPIEQIRRLEAQRDKDIAELEQSNLGESTRERIRESLQQAFEDKVEHIIKKQNHGPQ